MASTALCHHGLGASGLEGSGLQGNVQSRLVLYIIQFLKGMYLDLTLQVHPILPSVFSEKDSVFPRADT